MVLYDHNNIIFQNNSRPVGVLIRYMLDVAMGMHYIAEKGLVHRVRSEYIQLHVQVYLNSIENLMITIITGSCCS